MSNFLNSCECCIVARVALKLILPPARSTGRPPINIAEDVELLESLRASALRPPINISQDVELLERLRVLIHAPDLKGNIGGQINALSAQANAVCSFNSDQD